MSDYQPAAGQFCWNELMTNDTASAKEFYSKMLGWEHTDIEMGEFTYTMFKQNGNDVCGMMQNDQEGVPSHWMSYIMVDDVEASLAKAKNLGAEEIVPLTPVADFGKFFVVKDPSGAHIAFWQSIKSST